LSSSSLHPFFTPVALYFLHRMTHSLIQQCQFLMLTPLNHPIVQSLSDGMLGDVKLVLQH